MHFFKKVSKKFQKEHLRELYRELRWMWQYIRRYRLSLIFYTAAGLLGTALSLGISVVSKYLIDAVLAQRTDGVGRMALLMTVLALGSIAASALISRISAKITVEVQNEMRAELFEQILCSRWEGLHSYSTGDLLNRLNSDMNIVSENVISWIPSVVVRGGQFFGILALILYYDPTMALLALISTPAAMLISRLLLLRLRHYSKAMREISSDMMSFENDTFQNIQTLKAFGLMDIFSSKMKDIQKTYREKMMDYNKFSIFVSSYLSAAGMVVSYLCFGWSIYRLWGGFITAGTMTMFLQLSTRLSTSFNGLVQMIPKLVNASTSAGRLMELSGMARETLQDPQAEKLQLHTGALQLCCTDLTFSYSKEEPVFDHMNFSVKSGEIAAIIGPSGEGKTTLVRLLLGMLLPDEGSVEVRWNAQDSCRLSAATRSCFSYVPQGNTLFMGTIEENLRLAKPDASEAEMTDALRSACAWEFVSQFPAGLKYRIGEHGAGLSEGQAQRLAIARAILRDAPIMLLDEATSALDPGTEAKVLRQIITSDSRKLCIVITHRMGVLSLCDKIYELKESGLHLMPSPATET